MSKVVGLRKAVPFWLSLGLVPLAVLSVTQGGWIVLAMPVYAWVLVTVLDSFLGRNEENPDLETDEADLAWYRLITLIWFPLQAVLIYGAIWWVTRSDLGWLEVIGLMFGIGVASGTIGIVYAHELLHQKNRAERWLGDLLLATVLYSHFRTEHLLVHHTHVGTPRDAVTARYNEGFHRYFSGSCWLAHARPGRPRRTGWPRWAAQSGICQTRSGAMALCRGWRWSRPIWWAAAMVWGCSCCKRSLPFGNWSLRITSSITVWCGKGCPMANMNPCDRITVGTRRIGRRIGC
jgi:alkane 1-monooxygenase